MCEKVLDCACVTSKDGFYFCSGAISDSNPDHLRRNSAQGAQIVEIGVFGNNGISLTPCKGPNVDVLCICKTMKGYVARAWELIFKPPDQLP